MKTWVKNLPRISISLEEIFSIYPIFKRYIKNILKKQENFCSKTIFSRLSLDVYSFEFFEREETDPFYFCLLDFGEQEVLKTFVSGVFVCSLSRVFSLNGNIYEEKNVCSSSQISAAIEQTDKGFKNSLFVARKDYKEIYREKFSREWDFPVIGFPPPNPRIENKLFEFFRDPLIEGIRFIDIPVETAA